jgi:hypothetical protein
MFQDLEAKGKNWHKELALIYSSRRLRRKERPIPLKIILVYLAGE